MSKLTITEFLEARIAEDEGVARFALNKGSGLDVEDFESGDAYARNVLVIGRERVLAECAAKRAILRLAKQASEVEQEFDDYEWQGTVKRSEPLTGGAILLALASVYKDHPDYQQEWAL